MLVTPRSLLNLPRLLLSSTLSNSCLYLTLFSILQTLISRVAAIRLDRGDAEAAARAQALALILGSCGLRLNIYAWNISRDFMKNYQWKAVGRELLGVAFDLYQLLGAFGERRRSRSNTEIVAWAGGVSNSIFTRLLNVFHRSALSAKFSSSNLCYLASCLAFV
ncbi:uncharacterized protein LOC121759244 isoform X2 [Salvia splendens]|uniref:uncharacterized protein LOC121759244 isoform X2 n=1 Tax=Salvia splendens TaxID=180675 RepID=UPI001C259EB7|nr:uncharacterized protein LOC121759244 isoform X2 [Salvia splendens]